MSLSSITIKDLRNLKQVNVSFSDTLNFVCGLNASGKTSFLESIYLLSTGRSFRSRQIDNIVNKYSKDKQLIVFGRFQSDEQETKVGVRKSVDSGSEIKIDGATIKSAAVLAKMSPTLLIEPTTFDLLSGSPKIRRQFMDWGVFHVEHEFSFVWNEYIYCLKQRNTLLRTARIDRIQLKVWDRKLVQLGDKISSCRQQYMDLLIPTFTKVLEDFSFSEAAKVSIKYYRGWDRSKSLNDLLSQNIDKDRERKYTQYGPHRADIKLRIGTKNVVEVLSRGQQKLLVIALYIAHVRCLLEVSQLSTVVLIDDVAAELDVNNVDIVLSQLLELNAQVICTVLDEAISKRYIEANNSTCKMFHVEHGVINLDS